MSTEVIIRRETELDRPNLEHDPIFSEFTHPALEEFIQRFINQYKVQWASSVSEKLLREFFLYGFLKGTGQQFIDKSETWVSNSYPYDSRVFGENNGVLGVCDAEHNVWIRPGYLKFQCRSSPNPGEVQGTLIDLLYRQADPTICHSNGEKYTDPRMELLFTTLGYFSREVGKITGGTATGLVIDDLGPKPVAYKQRDRKLPEIILKDIVFIPGNKRKRIIVD